LSPAELFVQLSRPPLTLLPESIRVLRRQTFGIPLLVRFAAATRTSAASAVDMRRATAREKRGKIASDRVIPAIAADDDIFAFRHSLQPEGINPVQRIVVDVGVQVHPTPHADWIGL
jgi:hypothetical protein